MAQAKSETAPPPGVVMIFTGPDGRAIANAAAFERGYPAGYKLREFQAFRCKRSLAWAVVEACASPTLRKGMDEHDAQRILAKLCREGYHVHTVNVGDEP